MSTLSIVRTLLFCLWPLFIPTASGQTYPTRLIRLVIPFTPGGTSDVIARPLAEKLAAQLGQSVVVEYAPGAGGALAAMKVASAAPDGYTLLLGSTGALATGPSVATVGYDPITSFSAVGQVAASQYALVVPVGSSIRDLAQLIKDAQTTSTILSYGSPGVGSLGHLAIELFLNTAGLTLVLVPYRGQSPMDVDLYSGRLDMAIAGLGGTAPAVREGRLRALAVTGLVRSAALPETPTIAELGQPGFDAVVFWGVVAPAGLAPEIIQTLNTALHEIVAHKALRDFWIGQGQEPVSGTPAEFAQLIHTELLKWRAVVKKAAIKGL